MTIYIIVFFTGLFLYLCFYATYSLGLDAGKQRGIQHMVDELNSKGEFRFHNNVVRGTVWPRR